MPDFLFTPIPNQEAIDFIRSKPVISREAFDELLADLKGRAFTIAGAVPADVMQTVRDIIATLPSGQPWDVVKGNVVNAISPFIIDPNASAEERAKQALAAEAKAELLLRINGQEAYASAAYGVMNRQRGIFKYWQYQTMGDSRVRPAHRALDGIVLPADSPFWETHFPPWDWGCRCIVIPLSDSDVNDVRRSDSQRPEEEKRLIEGPLLRELELNNRLVRGLNKITNVAPPEGKNAFRFDPAQGVKIDLDQLRSRYSPEVFSKFESWARRTAIEGEGRTVWEWMNGEEGSGSPLPPPEPTPPTPVPTPLEETEARILGNKTESAHLFDGDDGSLIFSRKGTRSEVAFSREDVSKMKDGVLTHNHPRGTSLSFADVNMAIRADLAEIRAVGKAADGRNFIYSLTRPTGGWPLDQLQDIISTYKGILFRLRGEWNKAVRQGRATEVEWRTNLVHEVMLELARQFPEVINYERTEI
jgi:SPP1 gp7 family putative phage head morphogenesis protein